MKRGASTAAIAIPRRALAERATLPELVPRFIQWFRFVRRRSENSVAAYGHDLRIFLEFADRAGLHGPDDVDFRHLEFYMGLLQSERGDKPQTANRHLHALRAFYRWARREGFATTDPTADTFLLPTAKKLPAYLSVAEQEKVLATLATDETHAGRRDYALVATALLTGLRCSELAHLKLAHVNLDAETLRVVEGKGRKDRELPIVPRLATILRDYLTVGRPALLGRPRGENALARYGAARAADAGWVFVGASPKRSWADRRAGQALQARSIFHLVRRVVEPIVGRHVAPHMLRHSFASRLRAAGGDLQLIQEALGHASINTTTMYAHLATPARRQKLAELLEER